MDESNLPKHQLNGKSSLLKYESNVNLNGYTALVTGGTSGIGKFTVEYLARHGARVILTCREKSRGDKIAKDITANIISQESELKPKVENWQLDLADLDSIKQFTTTWGSQSQTDQHVDLLFLNAGALFLEDSKTKDGFDSSYQTNFLGHFLLLQLILPFIAASQCENPPRIVVTSSAAAYNATNDLSALLFEKTLDWNWLKMVPNAFYRYRHAKALTAIMAEEAKSRLQNSNDPSLNRILVHTVHPGMVNTGMSTSSHYGISKWIQNLIAGIMNLIARTPEQGAMTGIWAAVSNEGADLKSQGFWSDCQRVQNPPITKDSQLRNVIWENALSQLAISPTL